MLRLAFGGCSTMQVEQLVSFFPAGMAGNAGIFGVALCACENQDTPQKILELTNKHSSELEHADNQHQPLPPRLINDTDISVDHENHDNS